MSKYRYVVYLWDGVGPDAKEKIINYYSDIEEAVRMRDELCNTPDGHAGIRYTTPEEDRSL